MPDNSVGRASVSIFGDDSPFKRTVRNLSHTVARSVQVAITGDTSPARTDIEQLRAFAAAALGQASMKIDADASPAHAKVAALQAEVRALVQQAIDLKVDVDSAEGKAELAALEALASHLDGEIVRIRAEISDADLDRELGSLRAKVASMRDQIKIPVELETGEARGEATGFRAFLAGILPRKETVEVDVDAAGATGELTAFSGASRAASGGADDFSNSLGRMDGYTALVVAAIAAIVAGFAPLLAILTVGAAGFVAFGAGIGLVAAAAAPLVRALAQNKSASDQLDSSQKQLEQSTQSLADARENLSRAEREAGRSVEQARQQAEDATRSYRDAEKQADQDIAAAREQVARQAEALTQAEQQRSRSIADATRNYKQALEDLDRIRQDNASRLADAQGALSQAEEDYARTVTDDAQRERDAIAAVAAAERQLADTRRQSARQVQQAEESYQQAVQAVADAEVAAQKRVVGAYDQLKQAVEQEKEAERQRQDAIEGVTAATDDLKQAQENLNQALRDEPMNQEESRIARDRALLNQKEAASRVADLKNQLAEARAAGDTGREAELQNELTGALLDQEQAAIDARKAEEDLQDVRKHGSPELQQARQAVESAYDQRKAALEQLAAAEKQLQSARENESKARQGVAEAQAEADRMIADATRQMHDAHIALMDARTQAAQQVLDAERNVRKSEEDLARTRQQSARSEEDAAKRVAQARQGIADAVAQGDRQIADGQQRVADAYRQMIRTRADGDEQVRQAEQGLADAQANVRTQIEQSRKAVVDAHRQMEQAAQNYKYAQVDAAQRVSDAQKQVQRALEQVGQAQDDVAKKSLAAGAKLTAGQQAVYDAALGFLATFKSSFSGASEALDSLIAEMITGSSRVLPYLGSVAGRVVGSMRDVWREFMREAQSPEQSRLFRQFFDAVPVLTEDFAGALTDFAVGVFNILSIAMPEARVFGAWVRDIAARFADWTRSTEGNTAIKDWLKDAISLGQALLRLISQTIRAIWDFSSSPGTQLFFREIARLIGNVLSLLPGLKPLGYVAGSILWIVNRIIRGFAWLAGFLPKFMQDGLKAGILGGLVAFILFRRRAMALLRGIFFGFNTEKEASMANVGLFGKKSGGVFRSLGRLILGALVTPWKWVRAAVMGAGGWFTWLFRTGRARMGSLAEYIAARFARAGRWLAPVTEAFSRVFGKSGVVRFVEWFVERIGVRGGLLAIGAALPGPGWVTDLAAILIGPFAALATWYEMEFHPRLSALISAIFGNHGMIKSELTNFMYTLFDMPIFGGIIEYLAKKFAPQMESVLKSLQSWLSGIFKWIGESTVFGWMQGIWDHVQEFWDMLVSMAKEALKQVENALGIGSPSKEAAWQTEMLMAGYLKPIPEGARRIREAMRAVGDAMLVDGPDLGSTVVARRSLYTGADLAVSVQHRVAEASRAGFERLEAALDRVTRKEARLQVLLNGEIIGEDVVRFLAERAEIEQMRRSS